MTGGPRKHPPRPCLIRGCPGLVRDGGRYCDKHRGIIRDRPKTAERGYDARWRRVRAAYLKMYPLCADCGGKAEMVHHIKAIEDGGDRLSWDNLTPLCRKCHACREAERNTRMVAAHRP